MNIHRFNYANEHQSLHLPASSVAIFNESDEQQHRHGPRLVFHPRPNSVGGRSTKFHEFHVSSHFVLCGAGAAARWLWPVPSASPVLKKNSETNRQPKNFPNEWTHTRYAGEQRLIVLPPTPPRARTKRTQTPTSAKHLPGRQTTQLLATVPQLSIKNCRGRSRSISSKNFIHSSSTDLCSRD
jgi:hypothetical protein